MTASNKFVSFWVLAVTATVAGFSLCWVANVIHDFPEVVDWCIASSGGYLAAELVDLCWLRKYIRSRGYK